MSQPAVTLAGDTLVEGSTEEKNEPKINDANQYKSYDGVLGDLPLPFDSSFPVSEDSMERREFRENRPAIISILDESHTRWCSITCVGRVHEDPNLRIRTTVLVTFRTLPEATKAQSLKEQLEKTVQLPVEFVEGEIVKRYFGHKERTNPLVSGSSCGVRELGGSETIGGTGTIGGFITIAGDPDKEAVYAVTCHHVISEHAPPIIWRGFANPGKALTPKVVSDSLSWLGLRARGRDRLANILQVIETMKPRFQYRYEDRTEYLRDFGKQYINLLRMPEFPQEEVNRLSNSFEQSLLRAADYTIPANDFNQLQLETFGSDRYTSLIYMDMTTSVKPHGYVLGLFMKDVIGSDKRGRDKLKELLHRRRVCRVASKLLNAEQIAVEHPSAEDREDVLNRLHDDQYSLEMCINHIGSSGEDHGHERPHADRATFQYTNDMPTVDSKIQQAQGHNVSPERFIGVVWASSGIRTQPLLHPDPRHHYNQINEDWALIKLFRGDGQRFSNACSTNPLRPTLPNGQNGDRFREVKPWHGAARFGAWKRGRTTNVTVSETNGEVSFLNEESKTQEFSIAKTSYGMDFSYNGDSGSWIMDRVGQLVGMIWGGNDGDKMTYFTPGDYLFRWIEEEFLAAMERSGRHVDGDFGPGQRVRLWNPDEDPAGDDGPGAGDDPPGAGDDPSGDDQSGRDTPGGSQRHRRRRRRHRGSRSRSTART